MKSKANEGRLLYLVCGVIGGLCLAYFWPYEQAYAVATDRDAKFAMCTVDVGPGLPEAIFVLDFVTGRLQGAMLNSQTNTFTNSWYANVAEDFRAGKGGKAMYTIIPGQGFLTANSAPAGGVTAALGMIYVGEMTSGKVGCYRFYYRNQGQPSQPVELEKVDYFVFRDAQVK